MIVNNFYNNIIKYSLKLIGISLFVYILYQLDFQYLLIILKEIDLTLFMLTIFLIFPYILLKMLRWYTIINIQGINIGFKNIANIYLSGLFLGVITPGRIGDSVKAFYLKKNHSIPIGKGFSGLFIDRLLDILILLIIGLIGTLTVYYNIDIFLSLCFLLLVIILVSSLFFYKKTLFKNISFIQDKIIDKGNNTFTDFQNGFKSILTLNFFFVILISLLVYIVYFYQCKLILSSMGLNLNIFKLSVFISIMTIITLIPITISGIGTRDITLIYFFTQEGISKEDAVVFSLIYLFIYSIVTALIGLIGWFNQSESFKKIEKYK